LALGPAKDNEAARVCDACDVGRVRRHHDRLRSTPLAKEPAKDQPLEMGVEMRFGLLYGHQHVRDLFTLEAMFEAELEQGQIEDV
jgi:hypothetical protein